MKRALAWFAENSVAANLLMVLILGGGLFMIPNIILEVFPEFSADTINSSFAKEVFSTFNQFYRVRITTAKNEVEARLEVVLHVTRTPARIGTQVKVLQFRME